MPSIEADAIREQIARMKALLVALEAECNISEEQHERFLTLRRELNTLRDRLASLDTHPPGRTANPAD